MPDDCEFEPQFPFEFDEDIELRRLARMMLLQAFRDLTHIDEDIAFDALQWFLEPATDYLLSFGSCASLLSLDALQWRQLARETYGQPDETNPLYATVGQADNQTPIFKQLRNELRKCNILD